MRWLLALLLVAPLGMAQAPIELATLAIEPFPANVEPLKEPTRTTLRLRASCALADGTEGTPVT